MAKYYGGCHCGRVSYEVETDLSPVLACNCAFCQKRGALWTYVDAGNFNLLTGRDDLSDYQFNRKVIHHLFCRNCGIGAFSEGESGINIRCLDGVDIVPSPSHPMTARAYKERRPSGGISSRLNRARSVLPLACPGPCGE